jgi:hypothetical protein
MANNCGTKRKSRNSSVFFQKMTLYLGYEGEYENVRGKKSLVQASK